MTSRSVRARFLTTTSGDGDWMKWTENTIRTGITDAKKRSRKVKRKVLRGERRRVEKRPISRLQTDSAIRARHVVEIRHESYLTGVIL